MEIKGTVNVLELIKKLSEEEIIEIYSYIMSIVNKSSVKIIPVIDEKEKDQVWSISSH